MLTPSDFIFNNDHLSEYAEFNYPVYEHENSFNYKGQDSFNLKLSFNSVKSSSDYHVANSSFRHYHFAVDVLQAIRENISPSSILCESPIFPGVRYLEDGIIVFERPPTHKVVSTYNDYRDAINAATDTSEYYLPIPWQTYIAIYNPADMRLVSVKMFFTSNSLSSVDQTVYAPPLYNFYSNGTLCRPFFSSMEDIEKYPKDISGVIASAYDWIWNSGFNFDITENISFFLASNKLQQFKEHLSDKTLPHYDWLVAHKFNNIPFQLPHKYHLNFFKCWEQIPLTDISSISWNPYTPTDFYYQHINNLRDSLFSSYVADNDFFIHEEHFDSDYHDEDECPDECVFHHEIIDTSSYSRYVSDKINSQDTTLRLALESSVKFLHEHRLISSVVPEIKLKKMLHSILENTSFSS